MHFLLQAYQDRVTLKEVPSANIQKPTERLVIIEPTQITDPDLIKYNTSLRMVLDKKKGTYKLQVNDLKYHLRSSTSSPIIIETVNRINELN